MARGNKVVNFFKNIWGSLDGKKTVIGSYATTILTALDVLDKIITNPAIHTTVESVVSIVPSWGVYATTGLAALGAIHKIIKIIRG